MVWIKTIFVLSVLSIISAQNLDTYGIPTAPAFGSFAQGSGLAPQRASFPPARPQTGFTSTFNTQGNSFSTFNTGGNRNPQPSFSASTNNGFSNTFGGNFGNTPARPTTHSQQQNRFNRPQNNFAAATQNNQFGRRPQGNQFASQNQGPSGNTFGTSSNNVEQDSGFSVPELVPGSTPARAPARAPARTPARAPARTPARAPARTPARAPARTPARAPARTPARAPARTPARAPARTPARTPERAPARTPSRQRNPTRGSQGSRNPNRGSSRRPSSAGSEVTGAIDFSGATVREDGKLCVTKESEVETLAKDPILECTHKNVEKCHYTYKTQFKPSQEEVCEENFEKLCQITFKQQAVKDKVKKCYKPQVKVCNGQGPEECRTVYESSCTTKYIEKTPGKFVGDTKCEKLPVRICGAGCVTEEGPEECHDKEIENLVDVPEEVCDLNPQKTCRLVTKLVPSLFPDHECTIVPQETCNLKFSNPRKETKPLISEWCLDDSPPVPDQTYEDRFAQGAPLG